MKIYFLVVLVFVFFNCGDKTPQKLLYQADVVIYGGTSAAAIAAVQGSRMGKSVILVCPENHLGGMTSGGLGWTDSGHREAIGGLAKEFYHRVWLYYQNSNAWKWQSRSEYENRGQGTKAIVDEDQTMWVFEPHVAEKVFEDLISEYQIPVYRNEWLDRENGVIKKDRQIISISMKSGNTYQAKVYLDATYEGDLMAAAGVSYHVGRESNAVYNEKWNGVQVGVLHHNHYFQKDVDPYIKAGDPTSGLLPRISPDPPGKKGEGDNRIQAYCYRMCLSNSPDNRVPFIKPEGYDPAQYELLLRVFDSGWREVFSKFDPVPNRKTDTNNHGPFSTDNIGFNYQYPEGSYDERESILKEHQTYQKGLMYFLANDSQIPEDIRKEMGQWGLAKDEFIDNENWPHQIYVREARRMIGEFVMTEHEVLGKREVPKPVGMGSYTMDSHNVQRYVREDGFVQNEGDIGIPTEKPYRISYSALVPKKNECENLLVPVCLSSSHIAYGSIRMEPVFMILGQSAVTGAIQAIQENCPVQDINYEKLRAQLLADNQYF
jgi:hypothetical protein